MFTLSVGSASTPCPIISWGVTQRLICGLGFSNAGFMLILTHIAAYRAVRAEIEGSSFPPVRPVVICVAAASQRTLWERTGTDFASRLTPKHLPGNLLDLLAGIPRLSFMDRSASRLPARYCPSSSAEWGSVKATVPSA